MKSLLAETKRLVRLATNISEVFDNCLLLHSYFSNQNGTKIELLPYIALLLLVFGSSSPLSLSLAFVLFLHCRADSHIIVLLLVPYYAVKDTLSTSAYVSLQERLQTPYQANYACNAQSSL